MSNQISVRTLFDAVSYAPLTEVSPDGLAQVRLDWTYSGWEVMAQYPDDFGALDCFRLKQAILAPWHEGEISLPHVRPIGETTGVKGTIAIDTVFGSIAVVRAIS